MRLHGPVSVSSYRPQHGLLVAEPPSGPDWFHELRLDGFRVASFDRQTRHGRVLIDDKRNLRTSIAVAAFSTR